MFAPYESHDIVERVLSAPPVDTKLRFGIWHRDRLTWRGIWLEAKVLGKSWVAHRNRNVKKFLIIGRARSGTTLLTDLLNAHPDVTCDREMLHRSVISPATYLDNLAQKSRTSAYGAKLLSYQMAQVQRLRYPEHFLAGLHDRGFRLIHLNRNTFDQTLSLMMAQKSGKYHSRENNIEKDLAYLDPQDFYQRLEWSAMLLEYEKHVLRNLPHISISYEDNLSSEASQTETAASVFEWIGVGQHPVYSKLKKVLPKDLREIVENYDEILSVAKNHKLL